MFGTAAGSINAPITSTNGSAGFTINVSQGITESAGGTIGVAGLTSVQSGLSSIILPSAANDFGQLTIPGAPGGVLLTDANAITLAGANTGGNLGVTAGGSVGQSAALNVSGSTAITASGPVSLNASNTFTGPVSVTNALSPVTLNASGDLNLGAISASSLGATAGDEIIGVGTKTVTGTTTLAAPNGITAGSFANDFGGAVSATTGGDLILRDANALVLGATSSDGADVFSEGAMTQTGAISDTGQFEVQGDGGDDADQPEQRLRRPERVVGRRRGGGQGRELGQPARGRGHRVRSRDGRRRQRPGRAGREYVFHRRSDDARQRRERRLRARAGRNRHRR